MPSALTFTLASMALFSAIDARPMLHSRSPSPRIMPGASESLSHWLANIGMHNFDWSFDDSPSSSARPSTTPTPTPTSSEHSIPSWSHGPSPSSSHTPGFSSSPSPSPTRSPSLNYYDPYATYFVYPSPSVQSSSTFHSWLIHHAASSSATPSSSASSSSSAAAHNILLLLFLECLPTYRHAHAVLGTEANASVICEGDAYAYTYAYANPDSNSFSCARA